VYKDGEDSKTAKEFKALYNEDLKDAMDKVIKH